MLYFQIQNPGVKNWISHEDNALAHISEYPGNIWVTENQVWADRVGAINLTKEEAQTIVDNIIYQAQQDWTEESELPYPQNIILP